MSRAFAIVLLLILMALLPAAIFVALTTACTGAPTVRLSEAWSCWFSGREVKDLRLTGLLVPDGFSILFWGRLGKVLSFFSGLYVVAEIVGYSTIVSFLEHLREEVPSLAKSHPRAFSMASSVLAVGAMFTAVISTFGWEERIFGSAIVAEWVNVSISMAALLISFIATGIAVQLLFRGLLKLVEKNFLWTKILALLLLTLGFHFDLLAS